METNQDNDAPWAKLRVAVKMAREHCQVWVDGSYYSEKKHKAGTAAIIQGPDPKDDIALVQAFNITKLDIRDSKHAELWAATLALEQMKNFNVERLTTDCPFVEKRIMEMRKGTLDEEKYNGQLFDRLRAALGHQPDMELRRVRRDDERIPLADGFAKSAAKNRTDSFSARTKMVQAPCIYHKINERGNIARSTFFYHPDAPADGVYADFDDDAEHEPSELGL